jgi:hypothetical protein
MQFAQLAEELDPDWSWSARAAKETMGTPATFELTPTLVWPSGRVANIAVPGGPVDPERHDHHGSGRHLLRPKLLDIVVAVRSAPRRW